MRSFFCVLSVYSHFGKNHHLKSESKTKELLFQMTGAVY
jgi:hypothetical protein